VKHEITRPAGESAMHTRETLKRMLLILIVASSAGPAFSLSSQRVPCHTMDYPLHSGTHDGHSEERLCFAATVHVPDAQWLRCHFTDYGLGPGSYVRITSLKDGNRQHLDAVSLPRYRKASAFFNGDRLLVELVVGPSDQGVFFELGKVTVGDPAAGSDLEGVLSLCDNNDSRASSSDPWIGRAIGPGPYGGNVVVGTAWLSSNGALLTAGHVAQQMDTVEFNVPPSSCAGTPTWAAAQDTYAVDPASMVFSNDTEGEDCPGGDCGRDWAVFACFPNANTGLLPIDAQGPGAFLRPMRPADGAVAYAGVTGYGDDYFPVGCTGDFNEDNHTQQTAFGPYVGEHVDGPSDIVIEYEVDTRGGNSGSPVTVLGTARAIGIHTDGGCDRPNTGNFGTSFENDELEAALHDFLGPNVVYVDYYFQTLLTGDGSVLRPFGRVQDAFKVVPDGGTVSIVRGLYQESFSISRPMRFVAPVGTVIIQAP
jgi:hypothetical protein